ncbi:MAG TPA: four helix bundle protein [Candidatus Saccharimonadales bacterium]|nr:four helix bundle protein [Candidatus Saccharimonadales bacterium]
MINVQERPQLLEDRTLNFASDIIVFSKSLPRSLENDVIRKQLVRSASSIGANYTEANNSSSKLDFKNKIYIAKKEASETRYWLKLAKKTNEHVDTGGLLDEVSQLVFIFQKIVSTMKNGN